DRSDKDTRAPERTAFLRLVWEQEDGCKLNTDQRLPTMGKKAPACLEQVGTVLSLVDRMASCWWACREGDHLIEYLCGSVASTGRAALRLMRLGFYDESLALCGGLGEIAIVLPLFPQDRRAFEEWEAAFGGDRLRQFSPVKVRLRLERLHSAPPQSHNILGVPTAGASLQDEGLLVCLNALAVALSLATAFGALLLDLENDIKQRI